MSLSPLIWLAAGLILLALETVVPVGIILWFGIGGALTAIGVWIGLLKGALAQWLFFFLSALAFLFSWIFLFKKLFRKNYPAEVRDSSLIELRGRVIKPIAPGIPGEVELFQNFHGLKKWAAESSESIPVGIEIDMVESKGVNLLVKKHQGRRLMPIADKDVPLP